MKVLVTTSRMPFALDEIRKLGQRGLGVIAADTFWAAPGSHSRFAEARRITASPRRCPTQFVRDVADIVRADGIDLVLPCFEESLYLAKHERLLDPRVPVFMSPLEVQIELHSKARMQALASRLGVSTPRTEIACDPAQLRAALGRFESYVARPVYSRGGLQLLTNRGPLSGAVSLERCTPTQTNPWLVQEFVHGTDVCTFSVAHHGRVAAHATYVHPREIEHAGGIYFESIEDEATLRAVQTIVDAVGYHGQISFDFRRTDAGLVLLECNPRPTAGVLVMSSDMFVDALFASEPQGVTVAPAGVRYKISSALIRDMILHWREAPADLQALLSDAHEVYATRTDPAPGLFQLLSYGHVWDYRRQHRANREENALVAAYFDDVSWNGEPTASAELIATSSGVPA